jgi:hypothetical protein
MPDQTTQNKPTAAAVLSIIAGVLGLVLVMILMASFVSNAPAIIEENGYDATAFYVGGIGIEVWIMVSAILVIVGGSRLRSHPASHTKWGVVILLFSIIGIALMADAIPYWNGFVGLIAAILGIVGGILALAFKPVYAAQPPPQYQQPYPQQPYPTQQQAPYQQPYAQPPPPQQAYPPQQPPPQSAYPPQQIKRFCPNCGRVIDENVKFCPNCGKQLA